MKICLFTNLFLPRVGGVEYAVHYLAKNLVEMGHKATVLVAAPGQREQIYQTLPYPVHRYRGAKGLVAYEQLIGTHLLLEKFRTRFDIVHAHRTYPAGYVATKIKKILNVPVVVTPHGDDIQNLPEINYGMRLQHKLEAKIKFSLTNADMITTISDSIKSEVLKLTTSKHKICEVPNGVELKKFDKPNCEEDILKCLNLQRYDKIILAVGRNHFKKGYSYLIKAMKIIVKKHRDTCLVIAGKNTQSLLPLINRLGLSKSVILTGIIDNQNLPLLYKQSNIFAMSTLIEGFSVVLIEAAASGLPIVATKVKGVRDFVREGINGFLVPVKSPDALAEKLTYLLENEELRETMGQQSHKIAKQYDWRIIAKRYMEVYQKTLENSKSRLTKHW